LYTPLAPRDTPCPGMCACFGWSTTEKGVIYSALSKQQTFVDGIICFCGWCRLYTFTCRAYLFR